VADPRVEAVYVASPSGLHAAHAIAAAEAGKHVLVEKPMATTVADCEALIVAAEKKSVVLMCGPSHGADAPVRLAVELIDGGQFGRARLITALNFTDFVYRPRRPEELEADREGGAVYSQGAHQVDIVRLLAGRPVVSVRATTGDWDPQRRTNGAYTAFMSFADGVTANLTYSGYGRYDSDEIMGWVSELGFPKDPDRYGDAKRVLAASSEMCAKAARGYGGADARTGEKAQYHEHFGFVLVSCEGADLRLTPSGVWVYGDSERRFVALEPPKAGRLEAIDDFVRAVRGVGPSRLDGRWGLETVKCCAGFVRSAREGREVLLSSF
jgi:phthalate 4,5-cis-dihydrodiol dehydrogenase